MDLLSSITDLSHEFGTAEYVHGGGGNTSVKNDTTLWVKPSGTALAGLRRESFIAIDRAKLSCLYTIRPPADASAREVLVRQAMENAMAAGAGSRASVETPLHDSLGARFVVHTHPAAVNGLTCSKKGKAACKELFPAALWVDYTDPGYTLCMKVREEVKKYKSVHSKEPQAVFLKNHGIFVAADTPEEIRRIYREIMSRLRQEYEKKGIAAELQIAALPDDKTLADLRSRIIELFAEPVCFAGSGAFDYSSGPISPDHIVYAKSFPYAGKLDSGPFKAFIQKNGFVPQVIMTERAIFGVAQTEKKAELALELAIDGALIKKYAEAFGGIDYMSDSARRFIENWEVESYRSKQI